MSRGCSMVYLALLYRITVRARATRCSVLRSSQPRADSRTSRNCPPISCVRIRSKIGRARVSSLAGSPDVAKSSSLQIRQRSPPRMAPATPKRSPLPAQPAAVCSSARRRCAAGIPRRVSLSSMTSSCSRAAAWKNSIAVAALLHDDVMGDSDTRRGMPAAHRRLADEHTAAGWAGSGDRFGVAGAILGGDLCLIWSDELFATSGLPASELTRARPIFDRMRTQLMGGQFLDVLESARGWDDLSTDQRVARARKVIRYKSAKYTIEHPLLIGAAAADVSAPDRAALSTYGLDLGEAFQLRDDLLGVFGDPAHTGKPAGDDLREASARSWSP